jgi:hypothetical protein
VRVCTKGVQVLAEVVIDDVATELGVDQLVSSIDRVVDRHMAVSVRVGRRIRRLAASPHQDATSVPARKNG